MSKSRAGFPSFPHNMGMESKRYDCLVIGAGIAGITAGIYLKRSNLSALVIDKGAPGGKLNNIHRIDNYPGIASIPGPELAMKLLEQATTLGVAFDYGDVMDVRKNEDGLFVTTTDVGTFLSTTVIVASGLSAKKLSIPGEEEFSGRGVSYCATCDGNFFKGLPMAVYGYQDHAVEDAIYLSALASDLYVIAPKPFEATEAHLVELKALNNVHIIEEAKLSAIKGEQKVSSISVSGKEGESEIAVNGVFLLTGEQSSSAYLASMRPESSKGFLKVDRDNQETSIPGLYAAGDVVDKKLRQLVNAGGEGAVAATSAISYIHAHR